MTRADEGRDVFADLLPPSKPAATAVGVVADRLAREEPRSRRRRGSARARPTTAMALLWSLVVLLVAVLLFAVVWIVPHGGRPDSAAVSLPIALSGVTVPAGARIGIVVTTGTTAEGAQWRGAAQGAVVARERLALGGAEIGLVVEDDHGTADGSVAAVRSLVDRGVAGIVYASSGDHLVRGVAVAAEAGAAVLLPYAVSTTPRGAWSLAPSESDVAAAATRALAGSKHPLLLDAGGDLPAMVEVVDALRLVTGDDLDEHAAEAARRVGADPRAGGAYAGGRTIEGSDSPPSEAAPVADVIVVSGPPVIQAGVVHALQARGVDVPILLTPEAVSPVFGETLVELGGAISPKLQTVGAAWGDAAALGASASARAMSAYLAAIRLFSADPTVTDLADEASFADSAAVADVRSHDAVLALAAAISAADGVDPADVRRALATTRLGASDGLAGPSLDFSQETPMLGGAQVLTASAQPTGLRPVTDAVTPGLAWIAEPRSP